MKTRVRKPLAARFWSKVDIRGSNECWEWQAAKHKQGYGVISAGGREGRNMTSHRAAWFLTHGSLDEHPVLHFCGNLGCCNPKHLRLGPLK